MYLTLQVTGARRFQSSVLSLLIDQDIAKFEEAMDRLISFEKQLFSSSCPSSKEVCYLLLPCKDGSIDWLAISSPTISFDEISNKSKEMHHLSSCNVGCGLVHTKDSSIFTCMLQNSLVYTAHTGLFYSVDGILESVNANSSFELREGQRVTYKSYYKSK